MEAKNFFESIGKNELINRGVISNALGHQNLLHSECVKPLEKLLLDRGIGEIKDTTSGWYFTNEGMFHNSKSREFRTGNYRELKNQGCVFQGMNRIINPFYGAPEKVDDDFYDSQLIKGIQKIKEGLSILESIA